MNVEQLIEGRFSAEAVGILRAAVAYTENGSHYGCSYNALKVAPTYRAISEIARLYEGTAFQTEEEAWEYVLNAWDSDGLGSDYTYPIIREVQLAAEYVAVYLHGTTGHNEYNVLAALWRLFYTQPMVTAPSEPHFTLVDVLKDYPYIDSHCVLREIAFADRYVTEYDHGTIGHHTYRAIKEVATLLEEWYAKGADRPIIARSYDEVVAFVEKALTEGGRDKQDIKRIVQQLCTARTYVETHGYTTQQCSFGVLYLLTTLGIVSPLDLSMSHLERDLAVVTAWLDPGVMPFIRFAAYSVVNKTHAWCWDYDIIYSLVCWMSEVVRGVTDDDQSNQYKIYWDDRLQMGFNYFSDTFDAYSVSQVVHMALDYPNASDEYRAICELIKHIRRFVCARYPRPKEG